MEDTERRARREANARWREERRRATLELNYALIRVEALLDKYPGDAPVAIHSLQSIAERIAMKFSTIEAREWEQIRARNSTKGKRRRGIRGELPSPNSPPTSGQKI
jgi:hypothetical protein